MSAKVKGVVQPQSWFIDLAPMTDRVTRRPAGASPRLPRKEPIADACLSPADASLYTLPIVLGVALVCFMLVHLSPGDPLVSVLPADASVDLQNQLRALYGFDRPYYVQFLSWVWRALHGDLGMSIASGRAVTTEVMTAVVNSLRLAAVATLIGFVLGPCSASSPAMPRLLGRPRRLGARGAGRERAALLARAW